MNPEVTLHEEHIREIMFQSYKRRTMSRRRGLKEAQYGDTPSDHWRREMNGLAAEFAFATFIKGKWVAKEGTYKDPDVFPDWQVRQTTHRNGHLAVHGKDNHNHRYVLVTGDLEVSPVFTIRGWIVGREAVILGETWETTPSCPDTRWISQDQLRSFTEKEAWK